jgi:lincosamide nucleotidyltransferase A/C/D/E
MDAARVLDLLADLEALGIQIWLDGGWAVDALLGEQTRPHDDLDLVSRLEDSAQIEKALGARGYTQAGGGLPHSFELVDADGFGGVGRILDRAVPCLTPEVVLVNHTTGYALDEEHERDVRALAERYSLPVPEFRRLS